MSKPYKVILTKKYTCVFEIDAINDIDVMRQINDIKDNKIKDDDFEFSGYELDYVEKEKLNFTTDKSKLGISDRCVSFFEKIKIKRFTEDRRK